jgi:transcriptional regulator with XRE-family HTH domain
MDGELGAFLRSRREAVSPTDVGLPAGSRRRTPGLRRAELATLAGISVDYLIRLEQGRDHHPSIQVLAAIADALRLDEPDRDYLQQLATVSNGTQLCPHAAPATSSAAPVVRPTVQAVLDALEPTPAVVVNHLADLLAWNDGYDRVAGPVGLLDRARPNLVWFVLVDPRARAAFPDWDAVADEQVSHLHQRRRGNPDTDAFATQLAQDAGPAFTDRWNRRPVDGARTGVTALDHPQVGTLRLTFETLDLADPDQQRMLIYVAADQATATGLDRLAGRLPGALRAISS